MLGFEKVKAHMKFLANDATSLLAQRNLVKEEERACRLSRKMTRLVKVVHKRRLVLRASAVSFGRQSSTAVVALLRLPAIFLGRKNLLRL